jgi:hypothetical protein
MPVCEMPWLEALCVSRTTKEEVSRPDQMMCVSITSSSYKRLCLMEVLVLVRMGAQVAKHFWRASFDGKCN